MYNNQYMNPRQEEQTGTQTFPNKIQQMAMMFKGMKNPDIMAKQMVNSNPQLQSIIQANNGNAKQAFMNMSQQMGVNPNDILKMLK